MKMNKQLMCGLIGFALGFVAHKLYLKVIPQPK
jgi:hypothetical protein